MASIFLSIGTNIGDRKLNVAEALRWLETAFGYPYSAVSSVIETQAVGFDGPPFLNAVVRFESDMEPLDVLSVCKKIERAMGRDDVPEYREDGSRVFHDRIIDIDILRYGDLVLDTPRLTIPHPRLGSRPFFEDLMAEMTEIGHN